MGIAYNEWDQRNDTLAAGLMEKILKSSDWAHLQLTSGTAATTLSSGASAGATSISTAATIPSGSYIVIGKGTSTQEVRLTTAVSGAGPFTVSWVSAEPLIGTHSSGETIGVGSIVKATTTRGAQMVIDLAAAAPNTTRLQTSVYTSHDGTTAGSAITAYVPFKRNAGVTGEILHCRCSATKEQLYFDVEGPRAGEANADGSNGSARSPFLLGDIVPYFSADTVAAVALMASPLAAIGDNGQGAWVSKNAANTGTWLRSMLRTLCYPAISSPAVTFQCFPPQSQITGEYVAAPWVVFGATEGLRGYLAQLGYGGFFGNVNDAFEGTCPAPGSEMIWNGVRYRCLLPFRTDGAAQHMYGFGYGGNSSSTNYFVSPALWVPVAAYP